MSDKKLINLNFPLKLLAKLDEFWPGRYGSRTEAIHDACRKLMKENKREAS